MAIEHLVYASSSSVYGANTAMPFSVEPVGRSSREPLCREQEGERADGSLLFAPLQDTHDRLAIFHGLRALGDDRTWRCSCSRNAFSEGEPIDVFNNGRHSRDFTYIDDIVEGVVRTLDRVAAPDPGWSGADPKPATSSAPYRIYNIGNNQPVELMHMIACLETSLGRTAQKRMLPMQAGDVPDTYADIDALVRDTGFRPSTPIEVGIERFVQWFRGYYKV